VSDDPYVTHYAFQNLLSDLSRVRLDLVGLYRQYRKPTHMVYRGVRVTLDRTWATPQVRDALHNNYYEDPEYRILESTLRPDDRYLELGGGIGFLATCACRVVGERNVFVYEANPDLANVVVRTTMENGFAPSVENAVLLADSRTVVQLHVLGDFWASSLLPMPGARTVEVRAESFGETLDRIRPSYLMIDIEGGEVDLLASEVLPPHVRAICLEVHPTVTGAPAASALVGRLIDEGFALDFTRSTMNSVYLFRPQS
jgi:FkbM family methyltransferase